MDLRMPHEPFELPWYDHTQRMKHLTDLSIHIGSMVCKEKNKPNISILSEEFLMELKGMEHKNLALEVLKKLLGDEIKSTCQKEFGKGQVAQGNVGAFH